MKFHAVVATLFVAPFVAAQQDTVYLNSGAKAEEVKVQSWSTRELKYREGGTTKIVPTDQVDRIELGDFVDVYRRGVADNDPDLFLGTARQQLKAKKGLMAQLGFVAAARLFYADGKEANGGAALEEMVNAYPDGGLAPEFYRMKFESYMGRGDAGGYRNAGIVAQKLHSDAMTKAWPQGLALEGEFYKALAAGAAGGDVATFQSKMRTIISSSSGTNPRLAGRGKRTSGSPQGENSTRSVAGQC